MSPLRLAPNVRGKAVGKITRRSVTVQAGFVYLSLKALGPSRQVQYDLPSFEKKVSKMSIAKFIAAALSTALVAGGAASVQAHSQNNNYDQFRVVDLAGNRFRPRTTRQPVWPLGRGSDDPEQCFFNDRRGGCRSLHQRGTDSHSHPRELAAISLCSMRSNYFFSTFSAWGPLGPSLISKSTGSPSLSDL